MTSTFRRSASRGLAALALGVSFTTCGGSVQTGSSSKGVDPPQDDPGTPSTATVDKDGGSSGPIAYPADAPYDDTAVADAISDVSPGPAPLDRCAGWTEEASFSQLSADGEKLGRPYAVWAGGENDIHVALGVQGGGPSPPRIAAVAHWNGAAWSVDELPATGGIAAISGTSAADLWVLSGAQGDQATILRNDGEGGRWTSAPLANGYGAGFDMVVLGPEHAIVSARADYNLIGPGSVLEYANGTWTPMTLPTEGDAPYTIVQLSAADATHVRAVGYDNGGTMGNFIVDAFDGAVWASKRVPNVLPSGLTETVDLARIAASSHGTYALAQVYGDIARSRLYQISDDLGTWTTSSEVTNETISYSQALLVTSGGTVVAFEALTATEDGTATGATSRVMELRGSQATRCALSPGFGRVVAVAPPGSPYVHLFAAEQYSNGQGAHHLVHRADP